MKYLKFNLNNEVLVKLTDYGKEVYIKRSLSLLTYYQQEFQKQHEKDLLISLDHKTTNGYTRFQMHDFMNVYGHLLTGQFNPKEGMPFSTDIYVEAHDENLLRQEEICS